MGWQGDGLPRRSVVCHTGSARNCGAEPVYFGSARGITHYHFASEQVQDAHGLVVPGTRRASISILEGLRAQETRLNPTAIMSDAAGATDVAVSA